MSMLLLRAEIIKRSGNMNVKHHDLSLVLFLLPKIIFCPKGQERSFYIESKRFLFQQSL